ncbi:hypothetical protein [Microvirga flavescens]|uniref:hypothetical protein n=1 Tax=Microvirga flavescens TaxID=2249811 RepID=UPI001300B79F|nr:hypothetical protein [Microvirga flavescens]
MDGVFYSHEIAADLPASSLASRKLSSQEQRLFVVFGLLTSREQPRPQKPK